MAWLKTTLAEKHADLFCGFINYLADDRMSKIKAISDKEKSNLYIQKPYAVYSFTLQKSLPLTLLSVTKRIFQGPAILEKVEKSEIDEVTTYFEEHFKQNAGFQIKPMKKIESSDKSACLINFYIGKIPFDFQEMQTLAASGLLSGLLDLLKYLDPLKNRLETGAISPPEVSEFLKSIYKNQAFHALSYYIQRIIAAGCLSIPKALALTEQQKNKLDNQSISQMIIADELLVQDALQLDEQEVNKLNQVFSTIRVGSITWRRALLLNPNELKILENRYIAQFIGVKIIPAEEAFTLTDDQLKWFQDYLFTKDMLSGVIDWKKVIQLDLSEMKYLYKFCYEISLFNITPFDEYFDKSHPNYHVFKQKPETIE